MTLLKLKKGQTANLEAIEPSALCYDRLMELGFVEGEKIKLIRKAPLGGPLQIQIRGTNYAIRRSDARFIQVS